MFSILSTSLLFAGLLFAGGTSVAINITNISAAEGVVRIAVFANADDFDAERNAIFADAIPLTSRQAITIEVSLEGNQTYGIGVYHDVNNNGELDTNALGIPSEPYAFSKNPSSKWKAPTFADISFVPGKLASPKLELKLLRWKER